MSRLKLRRGPVTTVIVLALVTAVVLALPVASSGQSLPGASVTVCQVSGGASAPNFAQVQVSVDQVAAFLNGHPGSFVGSCPESGAGGSGSGSAPLSGAVTVCRVSGSASAPILSEVVIAADQVAAYLNQNPGAFVGACPASAGGGNAGSTGGGGAGPLSAVVTVCRVTGSADAPGLAQLTLGVDQVAAFLNQNARSFVGTCPGEGGTVTQGPGRILGLPAGAALTICQVSGGARVLRFTQVNVAVDRVAAFLNQHPGSFVGLCGSSGDANGTVGNEPLGYVTICRVTGDARNPLVAATVRAEEVAAYLSRAGTIVPAPTSGCPRVQTTPGGENGAGEPSTTQKGEASTVVVHTTPHTVVTAKGAGVDESTKSDKHGKAKLTVKPKKKGIVTVRASGNRVVKRVGVMGVTRSGADLTG